MPTKSGQHDHKDSGSLQSFRREDQGKNGLEGSAAIKEQMELQAGSKWAGGSQECDDEGLAGNRE